MTAPDYPILELRVAITTKDYERLVEFYCAGLGIEPAAVFSNDGGKGLLIEMGRATLEIFDEAQAQAIDAIEAGRRVSGPIRFALKVPDLQAALDKVLAHGATLVHQPVITPWADQNVRLQDPDGSRSRCLRQAGESELRIVMRQTSEVLREGLGGFLSESRRLGSRGSILQCISVVHNHFPQHLGRSRIEKGGVLRNGSVPPASV